MTNIVRGKIAEITGRLQMANGGPCNLFPGETVKVLHQADEDGDVWVRGLESDVDQYIDEKSLTLTA